MPNYQVGGFGGKVDWGTTEVESGTANDLPYFNSSGVPDFLSVGSVGEILGVDGNGDLNYLTGTGLVAPIGAVLAWLKSFTNTPVLPSGWVECNGQTLSDANSVYDGQTIPNLNGSSGTQRFLRGSTTSGSTGGSETHTHTISNGQGFDQSGAIASASAQTTSATSTLPSYYEVVWIMRVK